MKITCVTCLVLLKALQCLAQNDSPFKLGARDADICLVKFGHVCSDLRWTSGGRLLVPSISKCLGVQWKTVGSEVRLYNCDANSNILKWECKNETLIALQGQDLYIWLKADNHAVLSETIGPENHLIVLGSTDGACSRTHRVLYTIQGNAAGRPCMFPFVYRKEWHSNCITVDSPDNRPWCSIETDYGNELWGYCPTNNKDDWTRHSTNGVVYQLNIHSALNWTEADTSCKQQSASLLSITDPHEQAYITALLDTGASDTGYILWTGLMWNTEGGWKWSDDEPFRYLKWDSGYPVSDPGHSCGLIDGSVLYSWQSSKCDKKLGYICYSKGALSSPTDSADLGFCSPPWNLYKRHCFYLNRDQKKWSDAVLACRGDGGDLASIHNLEDQSFVISQLGYASTDELWIGLNDRQTEGLFDWSDHSAVSFTSWEFGKPGFTKDTVDCVLIRGETGNWADCDCEQKHGFICMKSSGSNPSGDEVEQNPGCRAGWKKHGSYCYFIGTQTKTFEEAENHCKSSGSYMADVSTRIDNAFLISLVGLRPEKHFWLGLSNQKDFQWTNTKSVRYTHWNLGMPGNQQGCVAMATGTFAGLWDILPCSNKEKYICKHLSEGVLATTAQTTSPSVQCPDDWTKITTRFFCYKIFTGDPNKTWFEARDYCRAIGGDLLSIHSAAGLPLRNRMRTTGTHSSKSFWIGLSAPGTGSSFVWSDGSPVDFKHWRPNEPNNLNNVEFCTEFYISDWFERGSWNDVRCEKYNGWICQIPTGFTPKPPPTLPPLDYNITSDGWLEWKGNQYYFGHPSVVMEDARKYCKDNHGDLVTISSEAERVFLWKELSKFDVSAWIGLTVNLDKTFQWMDGSPVMYQKWDENQPSFTNFDEDCVVMTAEYGFWRDHNCGYEFHFICKRSSLPPVNATVAPTVSPKGGCDVTWEKIHSKCYKIIKNRKDTWSGAREQCRDMGGNLATIPSKDVQVILMSQMVDSAPIDLWIGLHSSYLDGFFWTDGQQKTYNNLKIITSRRPVYFGYNRYTSMSTEWKGKCVLINANHLKDIGIWLPKSCNDTNGFICHKKLDSNLPDSPESTASSSYIKIFDDFIKFNPTKLSWFAAKKLCEDEGANLVSLRTQWINLYIEMLVLKQKQPLWIGLNSTKQMKFYKYLDGWPLKFTHWDAYEPQSLGNCVYVDLNGKWKVNDCNQNMSSVCLKSSKVPPTEPWYEGVCPDDPDQIFPWQQYTWKSFRNYCYIFSTEKKTWSGALSSCVKHNATLTSIEDVYEQEFIVQNMEGHSYYWIGLFQNNEDEWMWLDNKVLDYTNWGSTNQGGHHMNGIIHIADGKWSTSRRWLNRAYICKKAKVVGPKTSPSPVVTFKTSSSPGRNLVHSSRHRTVVLVIAGISVGSAFAFIFYKKYGHRLPINAFDNSLFNSNQLHCDSENAIGMDVNEDEDDLI